MQEQNYVSKELCSDLPKSGYSNGGNLQLESSRDLFYELYVIGTPMDFLTDGWCLDVSCVQITS